METGRSDQPEGGGLAPPEFGVKQPLTIKKAGHKLPERATPQAYFPSSVMVAKVIPGPFSPPSRPSQRRPLTNHPEVRRLRRAVISCWLGGTLVALGQISAPHAPDQSSVLAGQLRLRLTAAQTELRALSSAANTSTNLPPGATASEAAEYQLLAGSLVRTYQEHLDELAQLHAGRQQQQELEQQANDWRGFSEPAPYSILLVDGLRDSVQTLTANLTASATTLDVLQTLSQDTAAALKQSDERLRRLAEQLESEKDAARGIRLTWLRELEQVRNRLAGASAALDETRRLKVVADLAGQREQLAFVQRQLAIASQQVRFSGADLEHVLAGLTVEQKQVEKEIGAAEIELGNRQRELAATGLTPTNDLAAMAELRREQVETGLQKLAVLRRLADTLNNERGLWQLRFATFDSRDLAKIRAGYDRLEHMEQLIRIVRPYFSQQLGLAASLIARQRNRTDAPPEVAQDLRVCLQQREELAQRGLRSLDNLERLVARWKESLDQERAHLPVLTRVRDLFSEFSTFTTKLWQFELFAAVDTITVDGQPITGRRSVTVGKIAMALLILTVGYWLAVLASRGLERLVVKQLKVESNQAGLIRRWVRVGLISALVIFSLVSVKIPLTIFAFLGGALAIGLGFGTQNLLKNFVSGIIILFERPFRVGDVLDIDHHRGKVVSIGIRSSVLKLNDGTETLIPNSSLLENNLTNWTYSDRKVRFSLALGVAYGSDTRRVAQLLAEVTEQHGVVQKDPAPQVIFQEFGANALNFELRYWVDVHHHNASQIGSDLRHMIAGTFAERGIIIAFPQRDLHLDTVRPLQIQIVPAEPPAAAAPPR